MEDKLQKPTSVLYRVRLCRRRTLCKTKICLRRKIFKAPLNDFQYSKFCLRGGGGTTTEKFLSLKQNLVYVCVWGGGLFLSFKTHSLYYVLKSYFRYYDLLSLWEKDFRTQSIIEKVSLL